MKIISNKKFRMLSNKIDDIQWLANEVYNNAIKARRIFNEQLKYWANTLRNYEDYLLNYIAYTSQVIDSVEQGIIKSMQLQFKD